MAGQEEPRASESSITELDTSSEAPETLATQASVEATIESCTLGGTESTCNNEKNDDKPAVVSENSAETSEPEGEKSLELAEEFMAKGSMALKESDYPEAVECFSRALEIKVAHYGELSPECVHAYYKYGCALLYKAQEESDPLGAVPKKEAESKQEPANGESSSKKGGDGCEDSSSGAANDVEEGDDGSDAEAEDEADEDETDLDLAWKMLDVARAIAEKQERDTMEKVDILSALAEVAMEREDLETSLSDYQKSLSILERLVEPDSRHIAELNFRICLCLEIGLRPKEAIPHCEKAISVCQARVQRLKNESKNVSDSTSSSSSATGLDVQAEIETLTSLASELEKKLEDLQQLASSAHSVLSQLLGMSASKSKANESGSSSSVPPPQNTSGNGCFDAPRISTTSQASGSSEVTHLGVVGRGVKRVVMSSTTAEQSPAKKPSLDSTEDKK